MLQKVRIRISEALAPESKRFLKRNKNILGHRYESLSEELSDVYYMKEKLISGYDLKTKKARISLTFKMDSIGKGTSNS